VLQLALVEQQVHPPPLHTRTGSQVVKVMNSKTTLDVGDGPAACTVKKFLPVFATLKVNTTGAEVGLAVGGAIN